MYAGNLRQKTECNIMEYSIGQRELGPSLVVGHHGLMVSRSHVQMIINDDARDILSVKIAATWTIHADLRHTNFISLSSPI